MAFPDDEGLSPVEFECPSCGERVYSEVLVCPNCGLHFFEEEPPDEAPVKTGRRPDRGSPIHELWGALSAVVVGWAASSAIAFLMQMLASRVSGPQSLNTAAQIILFIAGPLGALAGGYLAARLAQDRIYWIGLAVSILSLVPAYLIEAYWRDVVREPVRPLAMISWALLLLAGPLGGWLWQWLVLREQLPVIPPRSEMQLYYDLLALVRHDMDTADRLIDYERKRSPKATRTELIRRAIEHLERDRR